MTVPTPPTAGEPVAEAWGDVVHDASVSHDLQQGSVQVTMSNSADGTGAVVFPRAFASQPTVVVAGDDSISRAVVAKIVYGTVSATGFTAKVTHTGGTAVSGNVWVSWFARGPRA